MRVFIDKNDRKSASVKVKKSKSDRANLKNRQAIALLIILPQSSVILSTDICTYCYASQTDKLYQSEPESRLNPRSSDRIYPRQLWYSFTLYY